MANDARRAFLRDQLNRRNREQSDPEDRAQRTQGSAGRSELERAAMIETAIQQAIRQGAFDDLPGAGKPLEGLEGVRDPDWWIRRKIETEKLSGLGPPALTLRVDDARLSERLDGMRGEAEVREALDDFNARVVEARRQLLGGPPVITPTRDVEVEVRAWRERREQRAAAQAVERALRERRQPKPKPEEEGSTARGWFGRRRARRRG